MPDLGLGVWDVLKSASDDITDEYNDHGASRRYRRLLAAFGAGVQIVFAKMYAEHVENEPKAKAWDELFTFLPECSTPITVGGSYGEPTEAPCNDCAICRIRNIAFDLLAKHRGGEG